MQLVLLGILLTNAVSAQNLIAACNSGVYDGVNLIQVNCKSLGNAYLREYVVNSASLTIVQNCQFNNCGNIKASSEIQFSNVMFNGSRYGGRDGMAPGGAVSIDNVNAKFDNVTFINCQTKIGGAVYLNGKTKKINVTMNNIVASNNKAVNAADFGGGVVHIDSGVNLLVTNSTFSNNTAVYRGGSFFVSGATSSADRANLTVLNTNFYNGSVVTSRGGDFHVEGYLEWLGGKSFGMGGSLNDTEVAQGPSGGSISILGGNAVVDQVYFEGQRVSYFGSVFYVFGPGSFIGTNIETFDTQTHQLGGVFYNINNGDFKCTNCKFRNALAIAGGGLFLNWGRVHLENFITDNTTILQGAGGCMGNGPNGTITAVNGIINNSHAINGSDAGGLLDMGRLTTLKNVTFNNCTGKIGGAIFSYGQVVSQEIPELNTVPELYLENVTLQNGKSEQGGGMNCQNCKATFKDCQFLNNKAKWYGGGLELVIWKADQCPTLFLGTMIFDQNEVTEDNPFKNLNSQGGAIYMDTQAYLTINTTLLSIRRSKALMGNAIFNSCWIWGGSVGRIFYNPQSPDAVLEMPSYVIPDPKDPSVNMTVTQTVFFFHPLTAEFYAKPENNPFIGLGINQDSGISKVSFTNPSLFSVVNGSELVSNEIPNMNLTLLNAFGKRFSLDYIERIPIVELQLSFLGSGSSGAETIFFKSFHGPWAVDDATVGIYNLTIPNELLTSEVAVRSIGDGWIKAAFQVSQTILDEQPQILNLDNSVMYFKLTSCDTTTRSFVSMKDKDGTLILDRKGNVKNICVEKAKVDNVARKAMSAVAIIGIIAALFFGVYAHINREAKIYKVTSPFFTNLITLGCIIMLLSVAIQIGYPTNATCMAVVWLELIGFMLVGFSVILKTSRIKAIFINTLKTRGRADSITNELLGLWVLLFLTITAIFLGVWQAIGTVGIIELDPSSSEYYRNSNWLHVGGNDGWVQVDTCAILSFDTNHQLFPILAVVLHLLVEAIAAYYAYSCRAVPSQYNETTSMLLMAYSWVLSNGVLYPLGNYALVQPTSQFYIKCIATLGPVFFTLYLLHVPRLYTLAIHPSLAGSKGSTFSNGSSDKNGSSAKASKGGKGKKSKDSTENLNSGNHDTRNNSNKSSQPSRLFGASMVSGVGSNNASNNISNIRSTNMSSVNQSYNMSSVNQSNNMSSINQSQNQSSAQPSQFREEEEEEEEEVKREE